MHRRDSYTYIWGHRAKKFILRPIHQTFSVRSPPSEPMGFQGFWITLVSSAVPYPIYILESSMFLRYLLSFKYDYSRVISLILSHTVCLMLLLSYGYSHIVNFLALHQCLPSCSYLIISRIFLYYWLLSDHVVLTLNRHQGSIYEVYWVVNLKVVGWVLE